MDGLFLFLALTVAVVFGAGLDSLMRDKFSRWTGVLATLLVFAVFIVVAFGFQALGLIRPPE